MKMPNSARRLLAFTLAASVALPLSGPAFATSLEIGKTGENRLRKVVQAADTGRVWNRSASAAVKKMFHMPRLSLAAKMDEKAAALNETDVEPIPADTAGSEERTESQATDNKTAGQGDYLIYNKVELPLPEEELPPETEKLPPEEEPAAPEEGTAVPPAEEEDKLTETDPAPEDQTPDPEGKEEGSDQEPSADSSKKDPSDLPQPEEDPKQEDETPPMEEDQAVFSLAAERAAGRDLRYHYSIGFGVQTDTVWNPALTEYEERFRVELKGLTDGDYKNHYYGAVRYQDMGYDSEANGLFDLPQSQQGDDRYSFCIFPDQETLGRVPDQEFEGWYIYNQGVKGSDLNPWRWYYGDLGYDDPGRVDREMHRLEPATYSSGDWEYDRYGSLGDTWDQGQSYGYGYKSAQENLYPQDDGWGDITYIPMIDRDNPVSIVGRWKLSDESRAAEKNGATLTVTGSDESLTLYREAIGGLSSEGLSKLPTGFNRDTKEYWLRVGATVDKLDLDFNAYEIFYDYHTAPEGEKPDSPIQVSTTDRNGTTEYDIDSHKMLPEWKISGGITTPSNTAEDPAHSNWKVNGIRLTPSSGNSDYTDIRIVVTPPNGDKSKTTEYVFHVQRLTEPTLIQNPGNTPFGMIERDQSAQWGGTETEIATNKAAAKEFFRENFRFSSNSSLYPHDGQNNNGSIFRERYSPKAWADSDTNVDMDPEAIVVYQNSAFLDPGISLTDVVGDPVTIGGSDGIVERSLRLRATAPLSVAGVGEDEGTWYWYQDRKLIPGEEPVYERLEMAGGTDQIDLRDLCVLPGIYTLEYRYTDPRVGENAYCSDPDSFSTEAGKAGAAAFRRTVVVLPMPGDVDMDGAVTSADAEALRRSMAQNDLAGVTTLNGKDLATDSAAALFAYRVGNADCDDDIDWISRPDSGTYTDVELLASLPNPKLISETDVSKSDFYYIPLPTGESEEPSQRPVLKADPEAEGPKLELVYLGKEGGSRQEGGYTNNPTGPNWSGAPAGEQGIELQDTFWVGVKLSGTEACQLLKKGVDTFTLSLTYDARYLSPAVVLNEAEYGQSSTDLDRWKAMMQRYNLSANSKTVWSGGVYGQTVAADNALPFTIYDSRAITPLEADAGQYTRLTRLVFSVSLHSGTPVALAGEEDQWLFAAPFTLVTHPVGRESAQLVELGAGMSDFTILFSDQSKAAYNSSVESIFGGSTENLATAVTYANAGPAIPLGEDRSEVSYIYNDGVTTAEPVQVVYSNEFKANYGWTWNDETEKWELQSLPFNGELQNAPDWLTYNGGNQELKGTPPTADTYDFTISGEHYRLVVAKAPLHYWADNQTSYYGEEKFRDQNSTDFTFRYRTEDIQSFDWDRAKEKGISVDGNGAGLSELLADSRYRAPQFTAIDGENRPVTAATDVSTRAYKIDVETYALLEPRSTNYELIYDPTLAGTNAGLTILPRPFEVVQITRGTDVTAGAGHEVYGDLTTGVVTNVHAVLENKRNGADGFQVQVATPMPTDPGEGYYNGYPLTSNEDYVGGVLMPGDAIELLFQAELLQTPEDIELGGRNNRFVLSSAQEPRFAEVSEISIYGDSYKDSHSVKSGNYRLVSKAPLVNGEDSGVIGTVRRRNIIEFSIKSVPNLRRQYGDQLEGSLDLQFYIVKEGIIEMGTYVYNEETTYRDHGITVSWATQEEKDAYLEGSIAYHWDQVFTDDFNGRYLCLSAEVKDETVEGGTSVIRSYYEDPEDEYGGRLVVTPRTMTLTATPAQRYYGEENGELAFTYDPKELSMQDQQWILDRFGGSVNSGPRDGAELEALFSDEEWEKRGWKQKYISPTLTAVETAAEKPEDRGAELVALTNVGSGRSVIIEGASCKNYVFQYTYITPEGERLSQPKWGASSFDILPRPIVVKALRQTPNTETLTTMYADTKRVYTDGLTLQMTDVVWALPEDHTATTNHYYVTGGTEVNAQVGYSPDSATAIVNGDQLSLVYRATMVSTDSTDGLSYVNWTNFSMGHFNMDDADEKGAKRYPVQVSGLTLEGSKKGNYVLVYENSTAAYRGMPSHYQPVDNGINPGVGLATYYVPEIWNDQEKVSDGMQLGKVCLRPIESIQILSPGKTDYIYGEVYDPAAAGRDGRGMQIAIKYLVDEYDNYAGNVTQGTLTFGISGYQEDGTPITNFDDRSISIYWLPAGQESINVGDPDLENYRLTYRQYLSVVPYDGAKVVVAGKRGGQEKLTASAPADDPLQVTPRQLTLTAKDEVRAYGEENPAFSFAFDINDLAGRDRQKLIELGITGEDGPAALEALADSWGDAVEYTAPAVTAMDARGTLVTAGSNVVNGGQGGYPITLSGGSLTNYQFAYQPGTLYIYPRQVKIQSFISSERDPIYTIYADVGSQRQFETNLTNRPTGEEGVNNASFQLARSDSYYVPALNDYLKETGEAVYGEDEIVLKVTLMFMMGQDVDMGEANQKSQEVQVTNAEIVSGAGKGSNYVLEMTTGSQPTAVIMVGGERATGMVELRSIDKITISSQPTAEELHYVYGEPLNLSKLEVTISYDLMEGESGTGKQQRVPFTGTALFQQYGLYLHYYDSPQAPESGWDNFNNNNLNGQYRVAATGDHVSIAPTHDTQGTSREFAANGKYLIVSAQLNDKQKASRPIVLDHPITVDPYPLDFTLSATDKTYDGQTKTAGTLTLDGVYQEMGTVDPYHPVGVTDQVYPVTGSEYEKGWESLATGANSFRDHLTDNGGYTFTTGAYQHEERGPLEADQQVAWSDGYDPDREDVLNFDFLDANVAYAREPVHDNYGPLTTIAVQMSGLRLAGPDAANYTIGGLGYGDFRAGRTVQMLSDQEASATPGYRDRLPQQTIYKANRPQLSDAQRPQVEVDPHTNVVRVVYPVTEESIPKGEAAEYADELHFEYALEYAGEGDLETDILRRWAGDQGNELWGDARYFGGESAIDSAQLPEGYQPKEEDLPKPDSSSEEAVKKGQVYAWSQEDGGFVKEDSAYPGGSSSLWPNYSLYRTTREKLPRDTVFLPLVRAAETHNYNASPVLTSVPEYTSELVQKVIDGQRSLEEATAAYWEAQGTAGADEAQARMETAQADLEQTAREIKEAVSGAEAEALASAQAEVQLLESIGAEGKWPEEWPAPQPAAAKKTYRERIDAVSVEEKQSAGAQSGDEPFAVPTLEAVWFTDVMELPKKEYLDAVLRNNDPVRYRGYAWDKGRKAELEFEEGAPLSLEDPIWIEFPEAAEGEEASFWVNENNTARIYVDASTHSGGSAMVHVEEIRIDSGDIVAALGETPRKLTVTIVPDNAVNQAVRWSSSDPSVAAVDKYGVVTFVGVGTAVITATSVDGPKASITVTVLEGWQSRYPNSIFDFGKAEPFFSLDRDLLFYPEREMSRGEVAQLMVQFYRENPNWTRTGPEDFPDLTGEESYAEAARLLGSLGVMNGLPNGEFGGEKIMTRAEFVALLVRMMGIEVPNTKGQEHAFLDTFEDVNGVDGTWAYSEIDALSKQPGVLQGVGEGYFAPRRGLTRAEAASFLSRLLWLPKAVPAEGEGKELIVPLDVGEEHWARRPILRAVNRGDMVDEEPAEKPETSPK